MEKLIEKSRFDVTNPNEIYHPGFSIDCVLFGFHENKLKVLLVKRHRIDVKWGLPGGFMKNDETAEEAASKTLEVRTGVAGVFLRQFHLFSDLNRGDIPRRRKILESEGIKNIDNHWFLQHRYVTLGFYALIKFDAYTLLQPQHADDEAKWFDAYDIPELILDHRQILDKALQTLRLQLDHEPIGYNLLPEKFSMPDLQKLYETILGAKLERSNFKKRMLAFDVLINTYEQKKVNGHKPPYLYMFDLQKYKYALQKGLQKSWV